MFTFAQRWFQSAETVSVTLRLIAGLFVIDCEYI